MHPIRPAHIPQVPQAATEGAGEAQRRLAATFEHEYQGCYGDEEARVMSDMLVDEGMTTEMCRNHCEGSKFYATQVCCLFRARVRCTWEEGCVFVL